jgi:hypothetical protein
MERNRRRQHGTKPLCTGDHCLYWLGCLLVCHITFIVIFVLVILILLYLSI